MVDAQCPLELARFLRDAGYEALHVMQVGMEHAEDEQIWDYALKQEAAIITKDEDFSMRIMRQMQGSAIVWLRVGNCSNDALLRWFIPMFPEIVAQLNKGEKLLEIV